MNLFIFSLYLSFSLFFVSNETDFMNNFVFPFKNPLLFPYRFFLVFPERFSKNLSPLRTQFNDIASPSLLMMYYRGRGGGGAYDLKKEEQYIR